MSNPPMWGRENHDAQDTSDEARPDTSRAGKGAVRTNRSNPKTKVPGAKQQAINDAQESLHALLNPHKSDGHPRVISSSGAVRGPRTGRVAGPNAHHSDTAKKTSSENGANLLRQGYIRPTQGQGPLALPGAPGSSGLSDANTASGVQPVPRTRIGAYASRATAGVQAVRSRTDLLLGSPDAPAMLAPEMEAHKRSASQWITRYATHLVILVVVGALAAFGGLKAFTSQSAYTHALTADSAFTGTDYFSSGHSDYGSSDFDAQDFQLAMPRTAESSAPAQPGQAQPSRDVVHYKVTQGDTIASIAAKYNVLPETVMGSNGIFDAQEALAPGRDLAIPPVDGMYYVVGKNDSLNSIANRFQVDPSVITSYAGNKIGADGSLQEGQAIVVPGGMMPARETTIVYTVRRGDTLKGIAARFGVDVPTMVNSNTIPNPDSLQPGSQLRVLPVPGVEYKVKKGDTLNSIADALGVTPQMILDYQPNHLSASSKLKIDQMVLVPGGNPDNAPAVAMAARIQPDARSDVRPAGNPGTKGDSGSVPPKSSGSSGSSSSSGSGSKSNSNSSSSSSNSSSSNSSKSNSSSSSSNSSNSSKGNSSSSSSNSTKSTTKSTSSSANVAKSGTGSLMWPVNAVITQYFSSHHNGLDLATAAGTPIHAADAGKVVWSGWRTDGLGYCVIIDHLDGLTTVYGHQIRQPIVYVGQYVSKGQIIGYVGSTGNSTGPHVHFMVKSGSASSHYYLNPLAYLGR